MKLLILKFVTEILMNIKIFLILMEVMKVIYYMKVR